MRSLSPSRYSVSVVSSVRQTIRCGSWATVSPQSESKRFDEGGNIFEFPVRVTASFLKLLGPIPLKETSDQNRTHPHRASAPMFITAAVSYEESVFRTGTESLQSVLVDAGIRLPDTQLVGENRCIELLL